MGVARAKNGSWCFRGKYKDPITAEYKNYYKSNFRTKKEAIEAEHQFIKSINTDNSELTLDHLMEIYIKDCPRLGIKKSTIITFIRIYNHNIKEPLGKKLVTEISKKDCEEFQKSLIDKNTLKPSTINLIVATLHKVLNYAVDKEIIGRNPCKLKSYKLVDQVFEKPENFWELDEFKKFILVVPDGIYKDLFTFLFWSGCRIGEAQALTWDEISFKRKTIEIKKTVSNMRTGEMNPITKEYPITSTKNRKNRVIYMQDNLYDLLLERYTSEEKKDGFSTKWYIFGGIKQLKYPTIRRYFKYFISKANCKNISIHGLRHSHASWLINQRADDSLIADRLGHTINILHKTYSHIYDARKTELSNILDNAKFS
jgi:integrase